MDELQAGIEQPFAVLPQPPVLLQPGKAALDNPALGHNFERVQFAALGDLHCHMPTQDFLNTLREGLANIAAIGKQALHPAQCVFAARERQQYSLAIRHLGRRHRHRVRQPLRIHRDVALDARDFLARVIALQGSRVRVLHALRVDDQERAAGVAPQSPTGRANLIFLKPAQAG